MNTTWKELWEARARKYYNEDSTVIDGFDSGGGKLNNNTLEEITTFIEKTIQLGSNDTLMEIGCGAGMILHKLSNKTRKVYGIDYSESMVESIKKLMPFGTFSVSEADKIPFDQKFDKIISFSVFQYFPNYDYARDVVKQMLLHSKSGGKILICDVPNLEKKDECERYRNATTQKHDFKDELTHLYYPKGFFKEFSDKAKITIINKIFSGYENSKFRYFVLIETF